MPYEIIADEREQIVRVRVSGHATHAEHLAARRAAASLCRERQWFRMLVDLRELETAGVVSTASCFQFGTTYREDDVPDACRIAHLMPYRAPARDDVEFTVTVAMNRGILVRNFTEDEAARDWLSRRRSPQYNTQPDP